MGNPLFDKTLGSDLTAPDPAADPSLLDPNPMDPGNRIKRGKAAVPFEQPKFRLPGPVEKVVHYKDLLKCNHGGTVNLDPTEDRDTEIKDDLRIVTDVDLLDRVTISGCSVGCTKIVDIPKGRAKDFELRGGAIPVLKNLQATTDKGCTVTWKGFEIDFSAAIAWLHQHANPNYTGQCASYVRQGLNAGGLSIPGLSTYGMDAGTWGPVLERNGFEQVATGTVTGDTSFASPQTGDIVVFPAVPHHPNGHTAMWDGDHWVSDTVQNHFSSNQAHYRGHRFIIYRNRGSASGSGYQAHAQPE